MHSGSDNRSGAIGTDRPQGGWLRRLLTRETSGAKLIPQVDGLRFFAIGSVVLFHIAIALTQSSSRLTLSYPNPHAAAAFGEAAQASGFRTVLMGGGVGVELFFAISGLVLGLPFARHALRGGPKVDLRNYFVRRVTRIEPPYFIALIAFLAMWVVVRHEPLRAMLPHYGASLVYMHNVFFPGQPGLNSVLWSLEIEVQFYILAPLLAKVFSISAPAVRRGVIAGAIVLLGAAQLLLPGGSTEEGSAHIPTLANYLHFFLVGFLLADLYTSRWIDGVKPAALWDLVGLGAWAGVVVVAARHDNRDLLLPPLFLLGCCAAFLGPLWKRFFSWAPIYIIGGMCYTIYLYHTPLIQAAKGFTTRLAFTDGFAVNFLIQSALLCGLVLAVCSVLFALFEKPFMNKRWPQELAQRLGLSKKPTAAG